MSAITGIGEKRTIIGSASASSIFGTATRAISQPAEASAAICAVVASTSCVFVRVIDCTTTGAPPPMATLPTRICTSEDIRGHCRGGRLTSPSWIAHGARSGRMYPAPTLRDARTGRVLLTFRCQT